MRSTAFPLVLLFLAGCEDAVGLVGSCRAEMREVRGREGSPHQQHRPPPHDGDYSETWSYWESGNVRFYVFRWGASYERCEVSGPLTSVPAHVPSWLSGP